MSDATFLRQSNLLDYSGKRIAVANNVRLSRDAQGNPVVFRTSGDTKGVTFGVPCKPQPFPASPPGGWRITGVEPEPMFKPDGVSKTHLWPFAILTNAWQMVEEWSLSSDGKAYNKPTGHYVRDEHYWMHFTDLDFTQGCIRVIAEQDLRWLAAQILAELAELRQLNPAQAWISFEVV